MNKCCKTLIFGLVMSSNVCLEFRWATGVWEMEEKSKVVGRFVTPGSLDGLEEVVMLTRELRLHCSNERDRRTGEEMGWIRRFVSRFRRVDCVEVECCGTMDVQCLEMVCVAAGVTSNIEIRVSVEDYGGWVPFLSLLPLSRDLRIVVERTADSMRFRQMVSALLWCVKERQLSSVVVECEVEWGKEESGYGLYEQLEKSGIAVPELTLLTPKDLRRVDERELGSLGVLTRSVFEVIVNVEGEGRQEMGGALHLFLGELGVFVWARSLMLGNVVSAGLFRWMLRVFPRLEEVTVLGEMRGLREVWEAVKGHGRLCRVMYYEGGKLVEEVNDALDRNLSVRKSMERSAFSEGLGGWPAELVWLVKSYWK